MLRCGERIFVLKSGLDTQIYLKMAVILAKITASLSCVSDITMTTSKPLKWWAYAFPIGAVLLWSINIVVTRYAAPFIEPMSISFYRWLFAYLLLTPFVLPKVIQQWAVIQPHLGKLAVLGLFGMVCYQGFAYSAAQHTTATNMGLINALIPIFTIFLSALLLAIRPSRAALLGSLLSLFGISLVITQGEFARLFAGSLQGDLLMLIAVFLYAFYGIFLQRWKLQLPLALSLYVQIFFAVLFHVPLILWAGLDGLNASNWAAVGYAAVFPSIFSPFLWMLAIQYLQPNRSSIFMNLMPVFTAMIAVVYLNETWTLYHSIGGVLVLVGVIWAQRHATAAPKAVLKTSD